MWERYAEKLADHLPIIAVTPLMILEISFRMEGLATTRDLTDKCRLRLVYSLVDP